MNHLPSGDATQTDGFFFEKEQFYAEKALFCTEKAQFIAGKAQFILEKAEMLNQLAELRSERDKFNQLQREIGQNQVSPPTSHDLFQQYQHVGPLLHQYTILTPNDTLSVTPNTADIPISTIPNTDPSSTQPPQPHQSPIHKNNDNNPTPMCVDLVMPLPSNHPLSTPTRSNLPISDVPTIIISDDPKNSPPNSNNNDHIMTEHSLQVALEHIEFRSNQLSEFSNWVEQDYKKRKAAIGKVVHAMKQQQQMIEQLQTDLSHKEGQVNLRLTQEWAQITSLRKDLQLSTELLNSQRNIHEIQNRETRQRLIEQEFRLDKKEKLVDKENYLFINAMIFYQQTSFKRIFDANELTWSLANTATRNIGGGSRMGQRNTTKIEKIRVRIVIIPIGKQFIIGYNPESTWKPIIELFYNPSIIQTNITTQPVSTTSHNSAIFEQFFSVDMSLGNIPSFSNPALKFYVSSESVNNDWVQVHGPGALVGVPVKIDTEQGLPMLSGINQGTNVLPSLPSATADDGGNGDDDGKGVNSISNSFPTQVFTSFSTPSTAMLLSHPLSSPCLQSFLDKESASSSPQYGTSDEDRCQFTPDDCKLHHNPDQSHWIWHHASPDEESEYRFTIKVKWDTD